MMELLAILSTAETYKYT